MDRAIKKQTIVFPPTSEVVSGKYKFEDNPDRTDFISGLLQKSVSDRLGCGLGFEQEIKPHPWFAGIDWEALLRKEISPGFVPDVFNF